MHADSWAIKAKQLGLRSRAVFKLEEILQKTKVLKRGSNIVLDIGSAPGGWSEFIMALLHKDIFHQTCFLKQLACKFELIEKTFPLLT